MSDPKTLPSIDPSQYVSGPSWDFPHPGDPPWILAHLKPDEIREILKDYVNLRANQAKANGAFYTKLASKL